MNKYGCIGKKLTHSFSKEIHAKLADYVYELIELTEDEIPSFFDKKEFSAINVTIPYKQTVIPYLDSISAIAERIGAVNTIVNKNGTLYGYNTDYYGMKALIERVGIEIKNKKVLILGTGGTSKTARVVSTDLGASEILTVSRKKTDEFITYEEAILKHTDANVIINTTPSGMYPDCESKPIDIRTFQQLDGVIDAVYNPLCTNLVLDAKQRGIKSEGGLYMLVMQAIVAVEKFLDTTIQKEVADQVYASVFASKENIILTGMPGSGKSTVGKLLHMNAEQTISHLQMPRTLDDSDEILVSDEDEKQPLISCETICITKNVTKRIPNIHFTDFEFIDTDTEVEKRCGCSIKELINTKGELYFRNLETEIIKEVSSSNCRIIATGGGTILREENVRCLKQNGKIFFINANMKRLQATDNRPLSDTCEKLEKLYHERIDIYKQTADVIVPDMETPNAEANYIIMKREELIL